LQIQEGKRSPFAGNSISCTHPLDIPGTKQKSKAIANPSNSQRPKGPKKRGTWGTRT